MKLNLDIISDNLPQTYNLKRFGPEDQTLSLQRPFLYEDGYDIMQGRLYVMRTDKLQNVRPQNKAAMVCVGGQIPLEWASSHHQILLITNAPGILAVLNEINKIFDKFDDWDCTIRDELENDVDFDLLTILKIGTEILQNSIVVTNQSLQVMFSTDMISHTNNGLGITISDKLRPLSVKHSEMVKDVCRLERVISVPYMSALTFDGYQAYCSNLFSLGHFIGCISLWNRYRPFKVGDFPLAEHFFRYFQKAFSKYVREFCHVEQPNTSTLRAILNESLRDFDEYEPFSLLPDEYWVCFRLREKRNDKYMPKEYMCATLGALMHHVVCPVIHNDAIVGLIRLSDTKNTNISVMELFGELLNRMGYMGGVSNEFRDIRKVNEFLLQANYTAERCANMDTSCSVFFFRDNVLPYMLAECTGAFHLESLYSKGLLALIEYDKKRKNDLIKTLSVYLKNEMNVSRTANMLFIHRSSLIKRLDKIKRLTNAELDDPSIRLYYRMIFALWESRQTDDSHSRTRTLPT